MVYTISQIACIEREWPPLLQWHRIWLTSSYIEYIALTTAVPFNTGQPSAVSRSRQLKAALQVFSHYKVPLTFRYSWKRLRKRRSKNLIKFPQVYIAFVLQYVHCFEKKNIYWLNESWETRLPKRLKCTIVMLRVDWRCDFPSSIGLSTRAISKAPCHVHWTPRRVACYMDYTYV